MREYHFDCIPFGRYYWVSTNSQVMQYILNGRWYNWSEHWQEVIANDVRRNSAIQICHTPAGVWLKFKSPTRYTLPAEIFVRLTDIIAVTKKFEIQLICRMIY